MELKHTPRKLKLLMLEHRVDTIEELAHLIKHGLVEPPVELHIIYQYGDNELYTLSSFQQACNWMREVKDKRRGYKDYYLECYVVKNNRVKFARYYLEDVLELERQQLQLLKLF